jgi:hypothetical protein
VISNTKSDMNDSNRSTKHNELRLLSGNAPWSVLYCQWCNPSMLPEPEQLRNHANYAWAVTVRCSRCDMEWNICTVCDSSRKALIGKQALYNHNYKNHSAKRRKLASEDDAITYIGLDMASSYVEDDGALSNTALDDHDCSHTQLKYALQEFPNFECFLLGKSVVLSTPTHHSQGVPLDLMHSLDELKVRFHLRMSSLLCSLTCGQRDDLVAICNLCVNIAQKQVKECNASSTCLPCSSQLMGFLYVKEKYVILPNLPGPSVKCIGEHAHVSLFDCVADLLGQGLDVQHIYDSTTYDVVSSDASRSNNFQ